MKRIYLCGSIKKGVSDVRSSNEFWTEEDEARIIDRLKEPVLLLNPAKTAIKRQDYFLNFGCDIFLVQSADLVIADLRSEKGIGVGAELMFAKQSGIPVISWLPQNSHYRRDLTDVFGEDLSNWIHPFAYSLSDYIEDSLERVCERSNGVLFSSEMHLDGENVIPKAIDRFLTNHPEYALE